jgi:hypothetical protein
MSQSPESDRRECYALSATRSVLGVEQQPGSSLTAIPNSLSSGRVGRGETDNDCGAHRRLERRNTTRRVRVGVEERKPRWARRSRLGNHQEVVIAENAETGGVGGS